MALEMIGPIPGTVIKRLQATSCPANAVISADRPAIRLSPGAAALQGRINRDPVVHAWIYKLDKAA